MFLFRIIFGIISAILLCSCSGFKACVAEEFMQRTIADGVARLSVQPISMILNEINQKTEYGFDAANSDIKIEAFQGEEYGRGKVTSTIQNIDIGYKKKLVYSDCNGSAALWSGQVKIIKATRIMTGFLLNEDENKVPKNKRGYVIPDPGAISFEVLAHVKNFVINFPAREESLFIKEGIISFKAYPRLAQNQKNQTLTAQTSNNRFENIKLQNMQTTLISPDIQMDVPINDSNFMIQLGEGAHGEINKIAGTITVFNQEQELTYDGLGLDPDYNAEEFKKSYSCSEDLKGIIKYSYVPIENKLTPTAAMVGVLLGETAKKLEENYTCGFVNPNNLKNAAIQKRENDDTFSEGDVLPGASGRGILHASKDCEVIFNQHETQADAFGNAYKINGSLKIEEATQEIKGVVTYTKGKFQATAQKYEEFLNNNRFDDAKKLTAILKPVAPTSSEAIIIDLTLKEFAGLSIESICNNTKGDVNHPKHCSKAKDWSGRTFVLLPKELPEDVEPQIKGSLQPKLAKDMDPRSLSFGMCLKPTSRAKIKLDFTNVKADVLSGFNRIGLHLNGDLKIASGEFGSKENYIAGKQFYLSQKKVGFVHNELNLSVLDEKYNKKDFTKAYMHMSKIKEIDDENECSAEEAFALNISRMLIQSGGALVEVAGASLQTQAAVNNNVLESDSVKWYIEQKNVVLKNDLSKTFELSGKLPWSFAEMKIEGERINKDDSSPLTALKNTTVISGVRALLNNENYLFVRPTKPDSYRIRITAKNFENLIVKKASAPLTFNVSAFLDIKKGTFDVDAIPLMGKSKSKNPDIIYDVPTPIVSFPHFKANHIEGYFKLDEMTLPVKIFEADLSETQNGVYLGKGNNISGTITLKIMKDLNKKITADKAIKVTLPKNSLLDPYYDQATFNKSYENTKDLAQLLPWK